MNKASKIFIIIIAIAFILYTIGFMIFYSTNITVSVEAMPVETEVVKTEQTPELEAKYTHQDLIMLAKLIYGEASIVDSKTEQAAVVWCVLNRVNDPRFPNTIEEVVTQPYQFAGYSDEHPICDEYILLAEDVLKRYYGDGNGRVLPKDYLYFVGKNGHNWFTKEYRDMQYYTFDIASSPYEN